MENEFITDGFARALNKMAAGRLENNYFFAIPLNMVKDFLPLYRLASLGEYITSAPGETYHSLTGTDLTICVSASYPRGTVLFPVI